VNSDGQKKQKPLKWEFSGTAIITGATSGIGKEFSLQLAQMGFNLLLLARREELLVQWAAELKNRYNIVVAVKAVDLADIGQVKRLLVEVGSMEDITVLVNAAGFGTLGKFTNLEFPKVEQMNTLHVMAPVFLTHAILPGMIQRHQGLVVNISSVEVWRQAKIGILYTAAKEYIRVFSTTLNKQVKPSGVLIQTVCPGYTRTNFHKVGDYAQKKEFRRPSFMWMTPTQVVSGSLKAAERKRALYVPGFFNKLVKFIYSFPILGSLLRTIS